MDGHTIPYTPIAVDTFRVPKNSIKPTIFFLTRVPTLAMSIDDAQCKTSSPPSSSSGLLANNFFPIKSPVYCSHLTRKLLINKYNMKPELIRGLCINQRHMIPLDNGAGNMWVSLIDASHSPGSVMFFFEGYFGRILYTGDFRYDPSVFYSHSLLPTLLVQPVDVLYFDNTFSSPRIQLPSRSSAILEIINTFSINQSKNLILALPSLFRQELVTILARHLKIKYLIDDEELLGMFYILDLSHLLVKQEECKTIKVISLAKLLVKEKLFNDSIIIVPSAHVAIFERHALEEFKNFIIIPYSDSSSWPELHRFVSAIRPKSVRPIHLSDHNDKDKIYTEKYKSGYFDRYLHPRVSVQYHIPSSVLTNIHKAKRKRKRKNLVNKINPNIATHDNQIIAQTGKTDRDIDRSSELADTKRRIVSAAETKRFDGKDEEVEISSFECTFSMDCSSAKRKGAKVKVNIRAKRRADKNCPSYDLVKSKFETLCTPDTCVTNCWLPRRHQNRGGQFAEHISDDFILEFCDNNNDNNNITPVMQYNKLKQSEEGKRTDFAGRTPKYIPYNVTMDLRSSNTLESLDSLQTIEKCADIAPHKLRYENAEKERRTDFANTSNSRIQKSEYTNLNGIDQSISKPGYDFTDNQIVADKKQIDVVESSGDIDRANDANFERDAMDRVYHPKKMWMMRDEKMKIDPVVSANRMMI